MFALFLSSFLVLGVAEAYQPTSKFRLNSQAKGNEMTSSTSEHYLADVPHGPPDSILGIAEAFRACTSPDKVNVCVGAYRDADGKPWVLPSVREAEARLMSSNANKEYSPISGDSEFVARALRFAYGEGNLDKIAAVQTLSGTGACRIGGEFLARMLPQGTQIYLPQPTWGNHVNIFKNAGLDVRWYRYFDPTTNGLNFQGLVEDIGSAPPGSVILLHACAHNPTGCDPTPDQWKEIANLVQEKQLHPFFDSAYQGFASGDAEKDAFALRHFVSKGLKVILAQSFAKNFGLYGERCGTLSFVCDNDDQKKAVMSQLKLIIRPMYSSPPIHGSGIVKTVLSDENLRAQYYLECASMAERINAMRISLVEQLGEVGSSHDWSHITNQIGMFAFTGMNKNMVEKLTSDYNIFLTKDGRISLAGLNPNNIAYVARAVHAVTDGQSIRG